MASPYGSTEISCQYAKNMIAQIKVLHHSVCIDSKSFKDCAAMLRLCDNHILSSVIIQRPRMLSDRLATCDSLEDTNKSEIL